MRANKLIRTVLLFIPLFTFISNSYASKEFPNSAGNYFGQKPPELNAEIFAEGIVSINGRYEYGIAFSPDFNEMYFSTQQEGGVASIHTSSIENGVWQPIRKLSFTNGLKAGEMHPFISHDNKKIYFTAYNADFSDTKIWAATRTSNGWENAAKLVSPINDREVFYSTLAKNGDLFYTDIFKSQTYSSAFGDGEYLNTEEVEIEIGLHPFISPSQDYLLVDAVAKDQGRKDKDIYVYFKKDDGTWSAPVNLGSAVNTSYTETVPSVTPDGKYLFFSRYNEPQGLANFYWVSTKVIEHLRPQ